jgi:hypothetical protein
MRTPLLAAFLGFTLVGCLVGDSGTPGTGGDDGTGSNPGSGSDPGSGSGSGSNLTPTVTAIADKMAVTTELGKDEVITLTLTSGGSFAGDVTVTPTLVDSAGAALADGITVTGQPTVTLAANGMATAAYTVKVPSNATGTDLTGASVKFDLSSTAGLKQLASTLNVTAVFTATYAAGLGANVAMHPDRALQITVKKGAKIHFHNADTAVHITHGDGAFPHETTGATGGLANATYEVLTANLAAGASGNLGCHSHGNSTYAKFTVQ